MKATNFFLFLIALVLCLFLGLKIEEQYRDVRYLTNCVENLKENNIPANDYESYCVGLVKQDPVLFTFSKGKVAKYLQKANIENKPTEAPKAEPKAAPKKK
jgi:hypothetical protein